MLFVVVIFVVGLGFSLANGQSSSIPDVPVKDMVTMVDIGAKKCIPCKMMAPILESLEKEYKGKAAIIFIDVWETSDNRGKDLESTRYRLKYSMTRTGRKFIVTKASLAKTALWPNWKNWVLKQEIPTKPKAPTDEPGGGIGTVSVDGQLHG